MSEFYRITSPVAAKAYTCEECNGPIAPGERYDRHNGLQEGYMFTATICLRCGQMRSAWWDASGGWDPEDGPVWGELRAEMRAELGREPDEWLDEWLAKKAGDAALAAMVRSAAAALQGGGA